MHGGTPFQWARSLLLPPSWRAEGARAPGEDSQAVTVFQSWLFS